MIETQKEQERALLVGVELQQTDNFDVSMEELASLAKTAALGPSSKEYIRRSGRNMTARLLSVLVSWTKLPRWSKLTRLILSSSTID